MSGPVRPPAIPSPCVAVCIIEPETGYCRGCKRTIEEISRWILMDRQEKLACLERLKARKAAQST